MTQLYLRIVGGDDNGRDVPVPMGRFVIGRGEQADFCPPSDLVSRQHCAIHYSNGEVVIEDLGSRNGTFVNGDRIEGKQIAFSGSTLRIGSLLLELVIKSPTDSVREPDSSETKPSKRSGNIFFDKADESNVDVPASPHATLDANRVLDKFFDRNKEQNKNS